MARACIFCSSSNGLTKEHVVAEWISDLYKGEKLGMGTAEIIARDKSIRSFPIELFQQTIRVVCEKCNGGWMSKLEGQVRPVLGPMIKHGQAKKMTSPVQALLATWAVKTAFVLEYLHPNDRIVPSSEYHAFYAIQKPLPGYLVWLGHRTVFRDNTGRELMVAAREETISGVTAPVNVADAIRKQFDEGAILYRITFAIGHVAFVVFGHTLTGSLIGLDTTKFPRIVEQIWPVDGDVTWPPPVAIEQIGGIDGLHSIFSGQIPPPGVNAKE